MGLICSTGLTLGVLMKHSKRWGWWRRRKGLKVISREMAVNISKDLFRLFGLSGRFGWLATSSTSMTCVQARSLRLLESGRGAGSSNNLATRQLHSTSQHCLGVPAQDASVPLSPAVRYLVYTHNISNLSQITATGPGHRLLKG